jgi:hypothetical protein
MGDHMEDIKIKKFGMFDRNGKLMWVLDYSNLDVSYEEIYRCIEEQIYCYENLKIPKEKKYE